jgi:hypothetical protein
LANLYGLQVEKVPIEEHHEYYCSDEIEIWEVTTRQFRCDSASRIHAQRLLRHEAQSGDSSLTLLNWGSVEEVRAVMCESSAGAGAAGAGAAGSAGDLRPPPFELCIKQNIHVGIGNYLWPSSVVISR